MYRVDERTYNTGLGPFVELGGWTTELPRTFKLCGLKKKQKNKDLNRKAGEHQLKLYKTMKVFVHIAQLFS